MILGNPGLANQPCSQGSLLPALSRSEGGLERTLGTRFLANRFWEITFICPFCVCLSSQHGRRWKGKGEFGRKRVHRVLSFLPRAPKLPPSPSPFNTCHTGWCLSQCDYYWAACGIPIIIIKWPFSSKKKAVETSRRHCLIPPMGYLTFDRTG